MSKAELAIEKKYNGKCNCAQAVACSFAEEAGVDEETLKAADSGIWGWACDYGRQLWCIVRCSDGIRTDP